MLKGSCLCGSVRYEIDGPLDGAMNCHCSMCRKAPWFEITDALPRYQEFPPR